MDTLNLREKRTQLGMTQEQFARFIGVSVISIHRWEHGETPSPAMMRLIEVMLEKAEREKVNG